MFARWDLVPLILAKARIRRTDSGPSHNRPKVTAQLRVEKGRGRHDKATSRGRPPCCLQPAPESPTSPSQKSRRSLPHGPFPSKYSTVPQSAPSAQPGQLYPRCSISVVFFLCPFLSSLSSFPFLFTVCPCPFAPRHIQSVPRGTTATASSGHTCRRPSGDIHRPQLPYFTVHNLGRRGAITVCTRID